MFPTSTQLRPAIRWRCSRQYSRGGICRQRACGLPVRCGLFANKAARCGHFSSARGGSTDTAYHGGGTWWWHVVALWRWSAPALAGTLQHSDSIGGSSLGVSPLVQGRLVKVPKIPKIAAHARASICAQAGRQAGASRQEQHARPRRRPAFKQPPRGRRHSLGRGTQPRRHVRIRLQRAVLRLSACITGVLSL